MSKRESTKKLKDLIQDIGRDKEKFNIAEIKTLISDGININANHSAWETSKAPMYMVLLIGYELICKPSQEEVSEFLGFMISNEADLEKMNTQGLSVVGVAIKRNAYILAESLMARGVSIEKDEKNLLLLAIEPDWTQGGRKRGSLVDKLIKDGCDMAVVTKGNLHNLLTLASHNGLVCSVEALLKSGFDVNSTNKYNATALMYACGMPVNENTHLFQHNGIELTELLLKYGASTAIKTTQNRTAFSIAKSYKHHKDGVKEKLISLLENA